MFMSILKIIKCCSPNRHTYTCANKLTLPLGLHTVTAPISPINLLFFPFYDKCSIIQTIAFPLLCLSAPVCVIVCCYAQLSATEL